MLAAALRPEALGAYLYTASLLLCICYVLEPLTERSAAGEAAGVAAGEADGVEAGDTKGSAKERATLLEGAAS